MWYEIKLKIFFNLRICLSLFFFVIKDFKIFSNIILKIFLVVVFDDLDIEVEEEDEFKVRGKMIFLSVIFVCMVLFIFLVCVMFYLEVWGIL